MEDYDTGAQDFDSEKICLQNINMTNYGLLEGEDRCPNLVEKSADQFLFRVVLYLVIFIINVILVNILIGQISITLERVMKEGDKDYYLSVLELKAGFLERFFHSMNVRRTMIKEEFIQKQNFCSPINIICDVWCGFTYFLDYVDRTINKSRTSKFQDCFKQGKKSLFEILILWLET